MVAKPQDFDSQTVENLIPDMNELIQQAEKLKKELIELEQKSRKAKPNSKEIAEKYQSIQQKYSTLQQQIQSLFPSDPELQNLGQTHISRNDDYIPSYKAKLDEVVNKNNDDLTTPLTQKLNILKNEKQELDSNLYDRESTHENLRRRFVTPLYLGTGAGIIGMAISLLVLDIDKLITFLRKKIKSHQIKKTEDQINDVPWKIRKHQQQAEKQIAKEDKALTCKQALFSLTKTVQSTSSSLERLAANIKIK